MMSVDAAGRPVVAGADAESYPYLRPAALAGPKPSRRAWANESEGLGGLSDEQLASECLALPSLPLSWLACIRWTAVLVFTTMLFALDVLTVMSSWISLVGSLRTITTARCTRTCRFLMGWTRSKEGVDTPTMCGRRCCRPAVHTCRSAALL